MSQVCVAQMNSQNDIEQNFLDVIGLIQQAKAKGAELIVFPENFICFAAGKQRETAQRFDEIKARIEQLAFQHQIWIVAGTLPCTYRPNGSIIQDGRVRTTSLCISPEGKTIARYDKIHLFDVQVGDAVGGYQESANFEPGDTPVIAQTALGNIGLMVCYDLRFPELALTLRQQGAQLLTAPAAFTYTTGQKHWQLLLQARAIDTQCILLGAAQQGWHGTKRQTWGQAGIANIHGQWVDAVEQEGLGLAYTDFDAVEQAQLQASMPLMQHRVLLQY